MPRRFPSWRPSRPRGCLRPHAWAGAPSFWRWTKARAGPWAWARHASSSG